MQILVVGRAGYVGNLLGVGLSKHFKVIGLDLHPVACEGEMLCADASDLDSLRSACARYSPDLVIHAAGNKDIGYCELHADIAYKTNSNTVENICTVFPNSKIVYISTDYVFQGTDGPYSEGSSTNPMTIYGLSKLKGEQIGHACSPEHFYVVRTSAVYDRHASFFDFLVRNMRLGTSVDCFDDVVYSPTYYKDLVASIIACVHLNFDIPPILHICGNPTTRFAFASQVANIFGFDPSLVNPVHAGNNHKFLFPNLSLLNESMIRVLDCRPTAVSDALMEISQEG